MTVADTASASAAGLAVSLLADVTLREVHLTFDRAGIDHLLLKGPSIAAWIYARDELRSYNDVDLLVHPRDRSEAEKLLRQGGFEMQMGDIDHPRLVAPTSVPWARGNQGVDLHTALHGVDADPAVTWTTLRQRAVGLEVRGTSLLTLDPAARAMNLALHADQHGLPAAKPLHDLELGIARLPRETWSEASGLAAELSAYDAFVTGLCCVPVGRTLVAELGLQERVSFAGALRSRGESVAEGVFEVLRTRSWAERRRMLRQELAPSRSFMEVWSPQARRGGVHLGLAYLRRPLWLLARLPAALWVLLMTARDVRRRRRS